ncbi:hypothetical protein P7C70_g480, partial [Phenoliferia sp. Uapishka_3]
MPYQPPRHHNTGEPDPPTRRTSFRAQHLTRPTRTPLAQASSTLVSPGNPSRVIQTPRLGVAESRKRTWDELQGQDAGGEVTRRGGGWTAPARQGVSSSAPTGSLGGASTLSTFSPPSFQSAQPFRRPAGAPQPFTSGDLNSAVQSQTNLATASSSFGAPPFSSVSLRVPHARLPGPPPQISSNQSEAMGTRIESRASLLTLPAIEVGATAPFLQLASSGATQRVSGTYSTSSRSLFPTARNTDDFSELIDRSVRSSEPFHAPPQKLQNFSAIPTTLKHDSVNPEWLETNLFGPPYSPSSFELEGHGG